MLPRLARVLPRPRIFSRLDALRKEHSLLWLAAPPGSGKTTLAGDYLVQRKLRAIWYQLDEGDSDVAGFFHYLGIAASKQGKRKAPLPHLTPEYLAGLPAFTHRFFEQLFARMRAPLLLVFDNYQELKHDSMVHAVLAMALECLPPGNTILALSRTEPPAPLAKARADGKLALLGWETLRLTAEEAAGVALVRGYGELEAETIERLHQQTDGWAAGLTLALDRSHANFASAPPNSTPQALFDYFATEIFGKTPRETQEALVKTALLPRVTAEMAIELTGNPHAGRILQDLYRKNYFTYRHGGEGDEAYQYHMLFREFLVRIAREMFPPFELARHQSAAARLLEASGQIEDAANLWREAGAWDALAHLIAVRARTLVAEGRSKTIESWLRAFPVDIVARSPWLLYWLGVCRLPFDPEESRGLFERAYARFEARHDFAGLGLAWSGIIDTFVYAWGDFKPVDRWIAAMELRLADMPPDLAPEVAARVASGMFMALMYRQPHHPRMAEWAERIKRIVIDTPDPRAQMLLGNQLLLYYTTWAGDLASARIVLDAVRPPAGAAGTDPLAYIAWRTMQAGYHWFMAEHEASLRAVRDGLDTAERTGARPLSVLLVSQGVIGSLTAGESDLAAELLRGAAASMTRARPLDRAHYHYLAFLDALFREDVASAYAHAHEAAALADAAGVPFGQALYRLALSHALWDRGERREALRSLAEARRLGRGMRSMNIEFGSLFSSVFFALDRGRERQALPLLRKTLALARRHGYINRPLWTPRILSRLLTTALAHSIEIEYIQRLVRTRHLPPPAGAEAFEDWPWPVKIRVLGQFAVTVRDRPLPSSGKQQRKPLDLLKLLVASGERGISVEQAVDAICRGMDGTNAYKSYAMALHRLRRLIGDEAALSRDGRVRLDPSMCWVDAWAFETLLATGRPFRPGTAVHPLERAARLYAGPFLNDESGEAWAVAYRTRLQRQYLEAILARGRELEARKDYEAALAWFRIGLEQDDLMETLYQRILHCCAMLGRRAEGIVAYDRCHQRLGKALGIAPSSETDALRDMLLAAR
jgi:DNA-binding SARP family transcriptional activator